MRAVRGSPLTKSLILAFLLVAAGLGLGRFTLSDKPVVKISPEISEPTVAGISARYRLVFSAEPTEFFLTAARGSARGSEKADRKSTVVGVIVLDGESPAVSLAVRWKTPPVSATHRFAKLTLELPGRPTFTHVFDSPEDIDDFIEIPLPHHE